MAVVFGLETVFWSQPRGTMLSIPSPISPWWQVIVVFPELPPYCNDTLLCTVYVPLFYNTCALEIAVSLLRLSIPKLVGWYNI